MKKIIILLALALLSQGCVFVAGAAIGAAGAAVVYDHRKLAKILQDQHIAHKISDSLDAIPEIKNNSRIGITCFNQVVLLTGQTASQELRAQAGNIANSVAGVKKVYNQIGTGGEISSLTVASDTWVTTKVKTEMLATKNLSSGTIKVVSENGTVYLMGTVSQEQAQMAVDIARKVSGVQRVVKIFQYTN